MNTLYYGDNLKILRQHIADESVDLIYLDPPFNSNRNYNVLFKSEAGREAEAQIQAFEDSWHWNQQAEQSYAELLNEASPKVSLMIAALRQFIGENQMLAYLVMMAVRLVELHRVLKPTGSLYLHCDPTASHYLKVVLDAVFGPERFLSEIVWKRTHSHNSAKRWGPIHDVILLYAKTDGYFWADAREGYSQEYIDRFFKFDDSDGRGRYWTGDITGSGVRHGETGSDWRGFNPTSKGRHWAYPPSVLDSLDADQRIFWPKTVGAWPKLKRFLSEARGVPAQDVITDIDSLVTMGSNKSQSLGYPTQKPLALLERIINASSNPGDVVLDPFCGCGTAIAAAQKLGRHWIGIDITHLAIALQKYRLADAYQLTPGKDYQVRGEPEDVESARALASDSQVDARYQFQWWALSLVRARPLGGDAGKREGKKGSDRGVDGLITFADDASNKLKQAMVQVKSGHVRSGDVRDLRGVVEREGAAVGILVTLDEPSRDMVAEAASAGFYHSPGWNRDYPRIQILTIEQLLSGAEPKLPPTRATFKQAPKDKREKADQADLFGDSE